MEDSHDLGADVPGRGGDRGRRGEAEEARRACEAELAGRGVSYCALCDGPFFQDQVYIIHCRGEFRVQPVRQITNAVADGTVAAVMAQKYLEEHRPLSRT